ncbi:MAG: ThiF family adenylyltransferase [Pirellulales bacterium]
MTSANSDSPSLDRYVRQMRYAPLGEQGQRRLCQSRVLLCGCGALGSVLANTLARAGVGHLRIVDRDFLELNNLQRQVLYDEQDVAAAHRKAIGGAEKLRRINSQITIEPIVADVNFENIEQLAAGADLLLDGTDNFETRFLMNDLSLASGVPWIYGGVIGAEGQTMTILPGETACLRCLMQDTPPPGTTPTCDTAGILGGIVNVIASMQSVEALKILSGHREQTSRVLSIIDLWSNQLKQIKLDALRESGDCLACKQADYEWLSGRRGSQTAVLCGRNAVQFRGGEGVEVSLAALAAKLEPLGEVTRNRFLLRAAIGKYQLTLFADGRAIIGGTDDVSEAKSVYARYIGS